MTERIALDVHAHLAPVFPDELRDIAGVEWKPDAKVLVVDGHEVGMKPLFDPPALVAWMDRNNVETAWISIPPPLYRAHLQGADARAWTAYANDGLQRIAERYPGRLSPLPHLPLQAPDIALEVATELDRPRPCAASARHPAGMASRCSRTRPMSRSGARSTTPAPSSSSIPANARTGG